MELDIFEALRYLGIKDPPPEELRREMAGIAGQLTRTVQPRYTYRVFSVVHGPEGALLREAGITLPGKSTGAVTIAD